MKKNIKASDVHAINILVNEIQSYLYRIADRNIVFICIGTDRSTGDSFGPLVGTFIKDLELNYDFIKVYGTLQSPIHAKNIEETIKNIGYEFNDPYIIAVDASLGKTENIGKINLHNGPLYPGAGVSKNLPAIGDISITGIVNFSGYMEYMVLQNTRLGLVYNMAEITAEAIKTALLNSAVRHIDEFAVSI